MEFAGDPALWRPLLNLIPVILELVVSSWDAFEKPGRDDREVPITRRFVRLLRKRKNDPDFDLPLRIYSEVEEDNGESAEPGRIDIQFQPISTNREEVYFAFECKRLNVRFPSGFKSLADEYVGDDGMMCFVTGKYSKGHPSGGMIGYVMDGDTVKAWSAVEKAIEQNLDRLRIERKLSLPPKGKITRPRTEERHACLRPYDLLGENRRVNQSLHNLGGRSFTIYHLFLGVS